MKESNNYTRGLPPLPSSSKLIALFTVTFAYLHYNVFERGCEAISGNFAVSARNCLTFTFKYIVMQMRKVNREKGYCVNMKEKKPNLFAYFLWNLNFITG